MSLDDLRNALKTEKMVYGFDEVLKRLKNGKVKKVFVYKGFRDIGDVKKYAGLAGVEVVEMDENGTEIGLACKKQFSVSVLCY
tara:strand:- start:1184 stop:1432 length:249 start_codon:yes stop_codon:yes gene_type:complete